MKIIIYLLVFLCSLQIAFAQSKEPLVLEGGSPFINGFAKVTNYEVEYFIDTKGNKAFDFIEKHYNPVDSIIATTGSFNEVIKNEDKNLFIASKNGNMGLMDDDASWILQPIYSDIYLLNVHIQGKMVLALQKDGKIGYADTYGNILLPLKFEEAGILDGNYFDIKQNGKWGVYSLSEDKLVIPLEYEKFDYCGGCGLKSKYVFAKKNEKWGIVDFNNKVLVPFIYDHSHYLMRSDGWVTSFKKGKENVVVNMKTEKEYASPVFTEMEIVGGGVLKLKKNGKAGLIDPNGNQLVDFIYDDIEYPYGDFQYGPYLIIVQDKKQGIINDEGQIILEPKDDNTEIEVAGDYFIITENGKQGLLDRAGKELLAPAYTEIRNLIHRGKYENDRNLFLLKQKALYGFYNASTGAKIEPAFLGVEYMRNDFYSETLIEGNKNGLKTLFNSEGKKLLPVEYNGLSFLNKELVLVLINDLSGIYNIKESKEIIPAVYDDIKILGTDSTVFITSSRKGKEDEKLSLLDLNGNELLPAEYRRIISLSANHYLLEKQNGGAVSYSLYDRNASKTIVLSFTYVEKTGEKNVLFVQADNKYQLYDYVKNKTLINIPYDNLYQMENGFYVITRKVDEQTIKYGYVNGTGKLVVPIEYDFFDKGGYASGINYGRETFLPLFKLKEQSSYSDDCLAGIASFSGKIIVEPADYTILEDPMGNGFLVKKNKKFGIIDTTGKTLFPLEFDDIAVIKHTPAYFTDAYFSFPLLGKKGEYFQYYSKDGTVLPFKIKKLIENPLPSIIYRKHFTDRPHY